MRTERGAKVNVVQVRVDRVEVHLIEDIECVQAQIQTQALVDSGRLLQAEVALRKIRISEPRIWSFIPKLTEGWLGEVGACYCKILAAWENPARTTKFVVRPVLQCSRRTAHVRQIIVIAARTEVTTTHVVLQVCR